jgi:hypothetical protein
MHWTYQAEIDYSSDQEIELNVPAGRFGGGGGNFSVIRIFTSEPFPAQTYTMISVVGSFGSICDTRRC